MITGFILILVSFLGLFFVIKTDVSDTVTNHESLGKLKLYLGIAVIFIIGLVSLIRNL